MEPYKGRLIDRSVVILAMSLFLAACGGEQSVASKSAEAFREVQQAGTPIGGNSHGGHSADTDGHGGPTTDSAAGHAGVADMDHSTTTGMAHTTTAGPGHVAGMDHSKMNVGDRTEMHHHSLPEEKQNETMTGMNHTKMQHEQKPMAAMDHSDMPGMHHGSGEAALLTNDSSSDSQQLRPAIALTVDPFDAPAPISVSESLKENGAHGTRWITPGKDQENPPTPTQAIRDGQTDTPEAGTDHSGHGESAAATTSHETRPSAAKPGEATLYTCSMHPEVESDKPGKCPKCGMTLVKKK